MILELGYQMKIEEVKKELHWTPEEKRNNIPMYIYYTGTDFPYEMPRLCREALELLKETIEKLEKEL